MHSLFGDLDKSAGASHPALDPTFEFMLPSAVNQQPP